MSMEVRPLKLLFFCLFYFIKMIFVVLLVPANTGIAKTAVTEDNLDDLDCFCVNKFAGEVLCLYHFVSLCVIVCACAGTCLVCYA